MGRCSVGYQASKGKGPYRDNGGVIMIIRTATGKKDRKVHLYGQTMLRRTSPQQGNFNKRRNNRNRCKQKSATAGTTIDTRAGNRLRIQQRSFHRLDRMVRMKRTHNKRNPLGKGTQNNPRRVSRMEQAARDTEGTFHTLVAPKGKRPLTVWKRKSKEVAREKHGML
jgi:hypothetical protein